MSRVLVTGAKGFVGRKYDVLGVWRDYAENVTGFSLPCGHFLPEESPKDTLDALLNFLDPNAKR